MKQRIVKYLLRFKTQCIIAFLRLKHLILRRRSPLFVYFTCSDQVHISGNPIQFSLFVKGCHKILINNTYTIPGNTKQVSLILPPNENTISFQFFGWQQNFTKTHEVNSLHVKLSQSFEYGLNMFHPSETSFKNLLSNENQPNLLISSIEKTNIKQPILFLPALNNSKIHLNSFRLNLQYVKGIKLSQTTIPEPLLILSPFNITDYQP